MIRTQEWQRERPGLDPAKIHSHKSETGASYGGQHLGSKRINDRPDQVRGRQLDPGHLVVVAHSQVAESQLSQGGLSAINLAELGWRNGMVVGNPRREAGGSRLVCNRQSQGPGDRTHGQLGHAGLGKGPENLMIRGSVRAWSIGAPRIVGVFSVRDRIQPVPIDDLILDAAE
jgi:hypothetical protein